MNEISSFSLISVLCVKNKLKKLKSRSRSMVVWVMLCGDVVCDGVFDIVCDVVYDVVCYVVGGVEGSGKVE